MVACCFKCGQRSLPVGVCSDGQPDIYDLPGWSVVSLVHQYRHEALIFVCPLCLAAQNKKEGE